MPVNSCDAKPLASFTIEQLTLLRKLKESGISKEQVEFVFDSYDRLDHDLGNLYNIPVALTVQTESLQRLVRLNSMPNFSSFTSSGTTDYQQQQRQQRQQQQQHQLQLLSSLTFQQHGNSSSTMHATTTDGTDSPRSIEMFNNSSSNGTDIGMALEQESQEFYDFIQNGDAACCEEIRQFVVKHSIKQQQIAILSGICQSYVSRFLKGDLYEMSERSRRAICKWYLKYRQNPTMIAVAANLTSMFNTTTTNEQSPMTPKKIDPSCIDLNAIAANPSINDLLTCQRRERFVFRGCQIEVLERYFQENSYPTHEMRSEIATACNIVLEESVGRKLSERETVTLQIVSNWFANKRKDVKKAARENGVDISDLLLRSRGRPPQLFYYAGSTETGLKDFTNASYASDDSASESEAACVRQECVDVAEIGVKAEETYEAGDYGVVNYSSKNNFNFYPPPDNNSKVQLNGFQ